MSLMTWPEALKAAKEISQNLTLKQYQMFAVRGIAIRLCDLHVGMMLDKEATIKAFYEGLPRITQRHERSKLK